MKVVPESYSIEPPNGVMGKQACVCITHTLDNGGGAISPLIYLQRPKWIKSDEDWERIVKSVRLELDAVGIS